MTAKGVSKSGWTISESEQKFAMTYLLESVRVSSLCLMK